MAQEVKSLPAIAGNEEKRVWSLGGEDALEEEMAAHSSILRGEFHGQRRPAGYSDMCYSLLMS